MSTKKERALRGVLYVGHIPPGFCEPQMKKYFAQFGTITRLRLSRSKRTGGVQEAINTLFCRSQERCHTVVLQGVRNISDAP